MGDRLRFAFGIMGNAASLLLYGAPILTFSRIIRKKSTEGFSCIPYLLALLNSCIYTWYGLPIVSYKWENFPLITINGIGILLELSFIITYFCFASPTSKKVVSITTIGIIILFSITAIISTFVFHDHHNRKVFVGSVGLVASSAMYASPLIALKQVIKTKSVKYMPFYLSLFSFFSSILWMAYGLLSHDLFIAAPNMVGSPLGVFQLVIYCMYKKTAIVDQQGDKWDLTSINDDHEKHKNQLQIVVAENTNVKL